LPNIRRTICYVLALADEAAEFLTGKRHVVETDRILTTVLFTDIVGSTAQAESLGDQRWHALLDAHDVRCASNSNGLVGGSRPPEMALWLRSTVQPEPSAVLRPSSKPREALGCKYERGCPPVSARCGVMTLAD